MQQNKYCDIQEHCKLLCEANKQYNDALKCLGQSRLENARLKEQVNFLKLDKESRICIRTTVIEDNLKFKIENIRKLCSENLKYRCIASGYEPTKTTKILNKIIEIIDKEN